MQSGTADAEKHRKERERALGDGACQPVNDVGKPGAGELHARFEAAGLETEQQPPCQSPTLLRDGVNLGLAGN